MLILIRSFLHILLGASIPVLTTVNDLYVSGDAIHSIVGLMSVSVGHVLSEMNEGEKLFSQAVSNTYEKGLFEDDPFLDLQGEDAGKVETHIELEYIEMNSSFDRSVQNNDFSARLLFYFIISTEFAPSKYLFKNI